MGSGRDLNNIYIIKVIPTRCTMNLKVSNREAALHIMVLKSYSQHEDFKLSS